MRMGQGVKAGYGHGGITCVLQTQFSSFLSDRKTCDQKPEIFRHLNLLMI